MSIQEAAGVQRAFEYARKVEEGEIVVNRYVRLAIKRFKEDLDKFDLDIEAAERAIRFTELLRFSKGRKARQRIKWCDWQIFCLVNIFGFHRKDTGRRRFRYFYIEVARKNGKSTFLAAIGLVFLVLFDEAVPELYCGASIKKQADPVFKEMARMIAHLRKDFREMDTKFAVFKEVLHYLPSEGIVERVTSASETLDGLNPFCTILDEIHAHKDSSLFNVFKSGTGSRDNNTPIICMITTAGFSLVSFAYSIRKNFCQILEGAKTDDDTFIMIYSLDKGDDYNDEATWIKANPSLGEAMDMAYLRSEYRQAQNFASELTNFLTKNLNIWVGGVEMWIEPAEIEQNIGGQLTQDEIDEARVFLGLDIGMVRDISALAQISVFGDERIHIKMRYYMGDVAFKRFIGQGIPMDIWKRQGCHISVNPGKATDLKMIYKDMVQVCELLDVEQIGIDRWASQQLVQDLDEQGITVVGVGQGYKTHNECITFVERAMGERRFVLEDDPMLQWMFGNVVLDVSPTGDRKLNKKKSDNKIDGVSAIFDAIFLYIDTNRHELSSGEGLRTLRLR